MDMKETQEISLDVLVDVPTSDGGISRKRLTDLTREDLAALGERHRAREAESHRLEREQAQAQRQTGASRPDHFENR